MLGVILFRAQPFHNGHLAMVRKALLDCIDNDTDLLILIGSADKSGTVRNPLPIDFRMNLIINSFLGDDLIKQNFDRICVIPLNDYTDEADNSHTWGKYLYNSIQSHARCRNSLKEQITIYYADRPEIMLSWFSADLRLEINFKFLDRLNGITATMVRQTILDEKDNELKNLVPTFVYNQRQKIRQFLQSAKI